MLTSFNMNELILYRGAWQLTVSLVSCDTIHKLVHPYSTHWVLCNLHLSKRDIRLDLLFTRYLVITLNRATKTTSLNSSVDRRADESTTSAVLYDAWAQSIYRCRILQTFERPRVRQTTVDWKFHIARQPWKTRDGLTSSSSICFFVVRYSAFI